MNAQIIQTTIDHFKGQVQQLNNLIEQLEKLRDGSPVSPDGAARPSLPRKSPDGAARPALPKTAKAAKPAKATAEGGRRSASVPTKEEPGRRGATVPTTEMSPIVFAAGEKPTTIGGAMKAIVRHLTTSLGKKDFTRAQAKALLLADADFAKLHTQSPTGFSGNLCYWSSDVGGKLRKTGDGDSEVFTVVEPDFFN